MIKINLLPKKPKTFSFFKSPFFIGIIILILLVSGMGGIYFFEIKETPVLQKRISILDIEIFNLGKLIKETEKLEKDKQELLSKIDIIENIPNNSGTFAVVLDEISNILPNDIWLNNFKNENNKITLSGSAISQQSIDEFVKKMEKNNFFKEVNLNSVKENAIDSTKVIYIFEINGVIK